MSNNKKLIAFISISTAIMFQSYIDLYLPALPQISDYYHCSDSVIQRSLSFFLLGTALSCIPIGVLCDACGRRKILIAGLVVLTIGTLISIFTSGINYFLASRFLQGIGAGIYVICSAILIDIFEGEELITYFTYYNIAYSAIPIASPYIGGLIVHYFEWQIIFYLLFAVSLFLLIMTLFFVSETLKPQKVKNSISVTKVFSDIFRILCHKQFLWLTFLAAMSWGGTIAFFTIGSFLFQEIYAVTPYAYGIVALLLGLIYLMSTVINRKCLARFSPIALIKYSIIASFLLSFFFFLASVLDFNNLYVAIVFIYLLTFSIGFLFINTMTLSLSGFTGNAGLASSVQATVWIAFWSILSFVLSVFNYSQITLSSSYLILNAINLLIIFILMPPIIIPINLTGKNLSSNH